MNVIAKSSVNKSLRNPEITNIPFGLNQSEKGFHSYPPEAIPTDQTRDSTAKAGGGQKGSILELQVRTYRALSPRYSSAISGRIHIIQ